MTPDRWPTALTEVVPEGVLVRGYRLEQLAGERSFAATLWLLFTGELPDERLEQLVNAILVLSIDHGPGSPSALAARTVSSAGGGLSVAAAAGILAMGEHHGSPAGAALELFREIEEAMASSGVALDAAVEVVVVRLADQGKRFPGFGHRQHKKRDARIDFLLDLSTKLGFDQYVRVGRAVQNAYERRGHQLPINLDGAIAIALGPLPIPSALATAIFMVSRFAGLSAQAWEERDRMPTMRVIDPRGWVYDGPTRTEAVDGTR